MTEPIGISLSKTSPIVALIIFYGFVSLKFGVGEGSLFLVIGFLALIFYFDLKEDNWKRRWLLRRNFKK